MRPHRPFRPCLERLESRDAPANLTASFNPRTRTLTVTGDGDNNQLQIRAVAGDTTRFLLSSPVDTINNVVGDYQSPTGVHNLTIKLYGGNDSVTFSNAAGAVAVRKSVAIYGGGGANTVSAADLKVGRNFSITNGTNAAGTDSTDLINLTVGGSLIVNNGDGDTITYIYRNSVGTSYIRGSVTVTNGVGSDTTQVNDTNVGDSVKVSNGRPTDLGFAGYTRIVNVHNTTARSVVGGNVTVSYSGGNGSSFDGIWDTHVLGNVSFNHGSGAFTTNFDGYSTALPVHIRGSLSLTGAGARTITAGTEFKDTGLVVGGAFNVTTGNANDTLTLNKLAVGGATVLKLGNGNNSLTTNDSEFGGNFTLKTGVGEDTVNLETAAGTSQATTFANDVLMYQGDGADIVRRAGFADQNQRIVFYRSFVIHHGLGADNTFDYAGQEISPFGALILWVV